MLDELRDGNFALIRRSEDVGILVLTGPVREVYSLDQVHCAQPRPNRSSQALEGFGGHLDCLALLPFAQIKERGYVAHDDGAPIVVMDINHAREITSDTFIQMVPSSEHVTFDRAVHFDCTAEEYEATLRAVIADEIGNGEGANFVIPRVGRAAIADMSLGKALAIFKNLLTAERGTYWTFLFKFNDSYLIGATPERHVSYEHGTVRMNPISGTYRKNEAPLTAPAARKHLIEFLRDKKEINELFMVVDEELKQMARICSSGGMIIGPFLKDMARLVHTEYLLSGRSNGTAIQVLRESMFAATVTGSPIESACRVIKKYESGARRYYGSAIALLGVSEDGSPYLDSPIPIRTVEIDRAGEVLFRVGGTLVRDSDPHSERLETDVKFSSMLASMAGSVAAMYPQIDASLRSDEVKHILFARNQMLAQFWFFDQSEVDHTVASIKGKTISIIENEDDFAYMIGHMLSALGAHVQVIKFRDFVYDSDTSDLLLIGPGPGDPTDGSEKMKVLGTVVQRALSEHRRFLAVCLGHQILCSKLGMPILRKSDPQQGVAKNILLFGHNVRVGFYNTFAGNCRGFARDGVEVASEQNGEVTAVRGVHYCGMQFHPESILSRDGLQILKDVLTDLFSRSAELSL